jgi:hypothetical protein
MKAMKGGEPPVDWAALAPHIEHPTRESIVEALHWIGPLSAPDLKGILDDPEFHLTSVAYHVRTLVREKAIIEIGERPAVTSVEKLYFLASPE